MCAAIPRPSADELNEILRNHALWNKSSAQEGVRAFAGPLDLKEADLHDADLSNALLQGVDLRGSNLEGANLDGSHGLALENLAGARLGGAKLPSLVEKFDGLAQIDDLSKNARSILLSLVLVSAYCWLTILTTVDIKLLTNTATSPLPILGANIPIATFYLLVPVALLGGYIYLLVYLQNLWSMLGILPLQFPNCMRIDERLQPWILNSISFRRLVKPASMRGRFDRLEEVLTVAIVWYLVPLTLIAFWLRYLSRHDWVGTSLHLLVILTSFAAAVVFRGEAINTVIKAQRGGEAPARSYLLPGAIAALVMIFAGFSLLAIEKTNFSIYRLTFFPDLRGSKLSGESFRNVNFGDADASGAFLNDADLSGADLSKVRLVKTNLRGTKLQDANLENANLNKANLRDANLRESHLEGANLAGVKLNKKTTFKDAHLEGTDLRKANLKKSLSLNGVYLSQSTQLTEKSLRTAKLPKAHLSDMTLDHLNLHRAQFRSAYMDRTTFQEVKASKKTKFTSAKLREAKFIKGDFPSHFDNADLHSAVFTGTNLQRASFRSAILNDAKFLAGTDLAAADLEDARLPGADLSGAVNLTQDQLDDACGDPSTKLPVQQTPLSISTCSASEDEDAPPATHKKKKRSKH